MRSEGRFYCERGSWENHFFSQLGNLIPHSEFPELGGGWKVLGPVGTMVIDQGNSMGLDFTRPKFGSLQDSLF